MADDPETPAATDKPVATRRRGPRKSADAASTESKPRGRRPGPKSAIAKAEAAAVEATKAPVAAVSAAASKAVKAVKPRSTARGAGRAAPKKAAPKSASAKAKKSGGKWGATAIAGGLAAAGAAAAFLSLRGGAKPKGPLKSKGAKQADGPDSSASFNAGTADEGSLSK